MLSRSKVQEEFDARQQQQGFDFASPDPEIAWHVFKEFVQVPWPSYTTSQIGFECFHVWDRDNVLWLEFVWELEGGLLGARVGCLFSRDVPQEMAMVSESLYWSPEQEMTDEEWTLATYFGAVEAMPEFKACMQLSGWKCEM